MVNRLGGKVADRLIGLPTDAVPYRIRRDVPVPMPDGVTLLANHYMPIKTEKSGVQEPARGGAARGGAAGQGGHGGAVVLIRLPYGRGGLYAQMFAAPLARRGFQVFLQATRGTFGSGGQFRPWTTEREDGLATLAWLRAQPWCDGRIAMVGGSYFGHTQWAVAAYTPEPLICVSPHITSSEVISTLFYNHGAPQIHTGLSWSASIGRQERSALPDPLSGRKVRKALSRLPLQAADVEVAGAPVPFWRDFVAHAEPGDDFWSQANHNRADLTRMPPVSMVTGWWDLFLAGTMADYTALRAAGNPARIVVGPWIHGEPGELRTIARTDLTWLDHHLRGGPAPAGAPVRVFLQQADKWLDFDEWPPAATREEKFYLHEDRDTPTSTFTYDPADSTPTVGGPLLQPPGKQADNGTVEKRPDVLTFTRPAQATDLDLVGPVSARVYLRTGLAYADVFVRVCDVDPKGVSRNIVDGIRRLDPRTVPAADVTVGEDGVLAVDVELFPTAYRVRAGHRLRVQVSGGAFPRYARNMGTGEPFGTATKGRPCRFEIFHDSEHPSHVLLPVQ